MEKWSFLVLVCISFVSCEIIGNNNNSICFSFDQRACNWDEWAELVPQTDSKAERENKLSSFLQEKGIEVDDISIVLDFHDGVCRACGVCSTQDRFFVKINNNDVETLKSFDLLNFKQENCHEHF